MISRDNNGVNQYDGGKFMFITTDEDSGIPQTGTVSTDYRHRTGL